MSTAILPPATVSARSPLLALPGDPMARLLAGPTTGEGPESHAAHLARLGPIPPGARSGAPDDRAALRATIRASGLRGRGGGEFPMAVKLDTASRSPGKPVVVANAAEGEPASWKDRTLLELRPHLVLDGAAVAAAACGASQIVLYLRPDHLRDWPALRETIKQRRRTRLDPPITVLAVPGDYVAGESSSVVAALEGGRAIPRPGHLPVAASGAGGRPTVVGNVETLAHLALIARFGAGWFGEAGSPGCPGSSLVTLAGAVAAPGLVVEVLGATPGGQLLAELGGLDRAPAAVLVGGYAGRWIDGPAFWATPLDRGLSRAAGIGLGCGVIAPLADGSCGAALTLRLLDYLAGESARQCAPCTYGLPALADELRAVLRGRGGRRALTRLHRRSLSIAGSGACSHPDGAVALLDSALEVFGEDVRAHLEGQGCGGGADGGWFPAPARTQLPAGTPG